MSFIIANGRRLDVDESLIGALESEGLDGILVGRTDATADKRKREWTEPKPQIGRYIRKPEYISSLRTFNDQWFFDDPSRLSTHRKVLGRATVLLRRWTLGALRVLTFPTFERQRTFNSAVTQFLNEVNAAITGTNRDLEHLLREEAALSGDFDERRELEEAHRQRLESSMRELMESVSRVQADLGSLAAGLDEQRRQVDQQAHQIELLGGAPAEIQRLNGTVGQLVQDGVNLYHHLVNLGIIFRRHQPMVNDSLAAELLAAYPELRYVRCLLCDADDTDPVGQKDGLRVVRCRTCGFMYANPRLPAEVLQKLYSRFFWYEWQAERGHSDMVERFAYDYILALGRLSILRKHRLAGTLLDVGCSNAAFVRRASEWGFGAIGLELDAEVAKLGERISGARVLVGTLEDLAAKGELKEGSLDVITMFDLLEHLYEPFGFLAVARKLLARDGILVIETFRTDVSSFMAAPEQQDVFEPIEHIYMYSEANIRTLLKRCRLDVVETVYPLGSENARILIVCTPNAE
jgi:2-polyprenyl-3-methyl-5-hydroxy-6-metoxy-1,4-benzoquinol methylase